MPTTVLGSPAVQMVFCLGPPQHYVARLGVTGWSEAWGWTETEALTGLARVIVGEAVEQVPPWLTHDLAGVRDWLRSGYDVPVLEA